MSEGPESLAYRLVVFDCDGTLVDSQHAIVTTMTQAFEAAGLPAPDAQAVKRVVGLSLDAAVAQILLGPQADQESGDTEQASRIAQHYREAFLTVRSDPDYVEPLFPGAREALEALDRLQVLLGIATGKGRRGLNVTLESHNLAHFFVTLQTADVAPGKPHPGMLERAMAETGAETSETVLVGDTVFDIEMARKAGVRAVGVSWGYHEVSELMASGAHDVIDSFAELVPLLAGRGRESA
ncbi:MAG: HAD-IA family hydrolase [Kiloniellales bacterium]|nr:HAD-IA family hydrolase [Kiloniellales bacterium]